MLKGTSLAIIAAVAAVAVGGFANASTGSSSETLSLNTTPVALQAAAPKKPLMAGLDGIGLGKTLEDANINIGGYASASTTFYADPAAGKAQGGRGFDFENQDPTINQIGLFIERTVDVSKDKFDLGGRIEWIWGGDARSIHSTGLFDYQDNDEQWDPVQAYLDVALPVGNGLRVRAGKFVTPFGYETINPTTTPLYSRGLLFTYLLPFTHTGAIATYALNDSWTIEGGVVRGWDDALEDKNDDGVSFYGGAVYTFADKKQVLALRGIAGPEYANDNQSTRTLIEALYTVKYSDQWSFAVQGNVLWETDVDSKFGESDDNGFAGGLGGWASYTFSQYIRSNARLEYLYDGQGFRFGTAEGNNVYSAALGLTITPLPTSDIGSNLKIRPEVRFDYADNNAFGGDNNQLTFAIEGYFTF